MVRVIAVALLSGTLLAAVCATSAQPEKSSGMQAVPEAESTASGTAALPPAPSAKNSTIFGGSIRKIDPVLDEFWLNIYGQRPLKVLFDERTHLYRDGARIPLLEFAPAKYASVQTALDGTRIFAVSVHILSKTPTGQFSGRVLRYDPRSGKLTLRAASGPPFAVIVPATATFQRTGQSAFASRPSGREDLAPGALVSVTFTANDGQGIAHHIVVYAVPGSTFAFSGHITALDTSSGTMVLADPRDQRSYQLHFYPAQILPGHALHIGARVRVDATFDGNTYTAIDIRSY